MIKAKSVYAPREADDGYRVLITRFYPRGVKKGSFDEWIRDLAPSRELLRQYKGAGMEWDAFLASLREELGRRDIGGTIMSLGSRGKTSNVTLLCYERDGLPCHRYMIRDMIEGAAES